MTPDPTSRRDNVLYLAEVQKRGGLIGGRSTLKLLASQRGDAPWQAVTAEAPLNTDKANDFPAGMLVLVDIVGEQQIQRVQSATPKLLSLLLEHSPGGTRTPKTVDATEIEVWRESLTVQSQELERRRQALEAREEELRRQQQAPVSDPNRAQEFREQLHSLRERAEALPTSHTAAIAQLLTRIGELQQQLLQGLDLPQKVDLVQLRQQSSADLTPQYEQIHQECERLQRFVEDQEEELRLQRLEITALEQPSDGRAPDATAVERAWERYRMLDRSLDDQRQIANTHRRLEVLYALVAQQPQDGADPMLVSLFDLLTRKLPRLAEQLQTLQEPDLDHLRQQLSQGIEALENHLSSV